MTQAHGPRSTRTSSGALHPKNYVVGIIDNLQEAKQAVQALKKARYDVNEIRLTECYEAVEKVQVVDVERNWLQCVLSIFQDTTYETGVHIYQLAAQQGKRIVYVCANSSDDVDPISTLMIRYHAHAIKFFSPWSVSDVPLQSIPESIPGH